MFIIQTKEELLEILSTNRYIAILIYADWCPFSLIAKNSFYCLDVDNLSLVVINTDIADQYLSSISNSIPEIILIKDEQVIDRLNGVAPPDVLHERFNKALQNKEKKKIIVRSPSDITASRVRGKIIKSDSGKHLFVDRTALNLLFFMSYCHNKNLKSEIYRNGKPTEKALEVTRMIYSEKNFSGSLIGVHNISEKKDKKYLSKIFNRVNSNVRELIGENIFISTYSGYILNEKYEIIFEWM